MATTVGFPGPSGPSAGSADSSPDSVKEDDGGGGLNGTEEGTGAWRGDGGETEAWGETAARGEGEAWGADGSRRDPLQRRVDALGELLGLSRTRVDPDALAEAGELLDRIAERRRLSLDHTVVALAGATGSGKSSLFNALTGLELSEVGVRRPTTATPVACAWDPQGAVGLLERLDIAPQSRFARRSLLDGVHTRPGGSDAGFEGLILLDLPDHDSAAVEHRRQVDRLLELVDVLVWVVDPEKYADAVLHERYLRPLAGHADVTLVVLNQVDRLPYDAADQVLDDLRRLLDEDGLAVGEHGDAGAVVLSASALTGEGVDEVRDAIGQIVAERGAADRRLAADVDRVARRLRTVYVGDGPAGLTDQACEAFVARLAEAVGAVAVGHAAERDWSAAAARACGVPWARLVERGEAEPAVDGDGVAGGAGGVGFGGVAGAAGAGCGGVAGAAGDGFGEAASGPGVPAREAGVVGGPGQAVAVPAGSGLAAAHADGVSVPGVVRVPELVHASADPHAPRERDRRVAARPLVAEAVRTVAESAAQGLPAPWRRAVHGAARRGARGLPEALDAVAASSEESRLDRPRWWSVAGAAQWLLMVASVTGAVGMVAVAVRGLGVPLWLPAVGFGVGTAGGPGLAWACRVASRGQARRYGREAEHTLRDAAADRGRAGVLDPVAAELLRYREVREQYGVATGAVPDFRR